MISLGFHGAAGTVTGSKYLVRAGSKRILIDCGLFQGPRELRQRNWEKLPFDPAEIDGIILTHTHIDHIGYLPRMIAQGFSGPVFATPPTVEMAQVLLLDSAKIQQEDADYRNRKGLTRHSPALPLYTTKHVDAIWSQFRKVPFNKWTEISEAFRFKLHPSGHILGAASVELIVSDGNQESSILFSGDVGRYAMPLVVDPADPPETDYLVCESTYGGEIHPPSDTFHEMAELLTDIIERKSVLLVPSFAIGRTQQITYMINVLIAQKQIPPISVNVDSPMAVRATDIYCDYPNYHAMDTKLLKGQKCAIYGNHVTLHRSRKSSKLLNKLEGPAVILSASGMMSGGRIMHHLMHRLPNPETTLAVVGFMARGTIGRQIAEGTDRIYIHKKQVEVNARIVTRAGLSGHADSIELDHWLEKFSNRPKQVFITHGEDERSKALSDHFTKERGWNCIVPNLDDTIELQ